MSAVAWRAPADLRGRTAPSVAAGDLIRTAGNFSPRYQVIALSEDKAWVVDLLHGTNHVLPGGRQVQAPFAGQMPDARSCKCN